VNRAGVRILQVEDNRYQPTDWDALAALLDLLTRVAAFDDAYELYRLAP